MSDKSEILDRFNQAVATLPLRPMTQKENRFLALSGAVYDPQNSDARDPLKVGRILQAALLQQTQKVGDTFDMAQFEDYARIQRIQACSDPHIQGIALAAIERQQMSRLIEQTMLVQLVPPEATVYLTEVLEKHAPMLLNRACLGFDFLAFYYLVFFCVEEPTKFTELLNATAGELACAETANPNDS